MTTKEKRGCPTIRVADANEGKWANCGTVIDLASRLRAREAADIDSEIDRLVAAYRALSRDRQVFAMQAIMNLAAAGYATDG